jgi:hypothetical protein
VARHIPQILIGAIPPRAAQNPKIIPFCARYYAPCLRAMFAGVPVNLGEIAQTNQNGFIFDGTTFVEFAAPGSSQTPAFGVVGTVINGVNDKRDIVGFFSDGTHVNGFVQFDSPVGPQ